MKSIEPTLERLALMVAIAAAVYTAEYGVDSSAILLVIMCAALIAADIYVRVAAAESTGGSV